MSMTESLRDRLAGRWVEVLARLGVPAKFLTNRNCACPLCGGKDRFRFTPSNGLYICSQCGGGDGVDLVMKFHGWDFKAAIEKIEPIAAIAKVRQAKSTDPDKMQAIVDLWKRSDAITPRDPAGRYLTKRTGITEYPSCLRMVASLAYWDGKVERHFPAMLAKVVDPAGKSVNVYRTYLTLDGEKAPVDPPRRMMSGSVPRGSAVRLAEVDGETLGVAEGVETAISAMVLFGVPVWALLGTSGLQSWSPPVGITKVVIFGDADLNFAGQLAAYSLGHRLAMMPKRKLEVEVRIPGHQNEKLDWNDVFLKK